MSEGATLARQIRSEIDHLHFSLWTGSPSLSAAKWSVFGLGLVWFSSVYWSGILLWSVVGILWVLYCVLLHVFYSRRLSVYRRHLNLRLRQSGLIERLALGWEALPDIYRWTAFPFSLLLGPRPTTLKAWVTLVARNLDWYVEEPRWLFRCHWLYPLLAFAAILIPHLADQLGLVSPLVAARARFGANSALAVMLLTLAGVIVVGTIMQYGAMQHATRLRVVRDYLDELLQ